MRTTRFVRLLACTGLVLIFSVAIVATASAQATTPEATPDATAIMQQMMSMPGACPQGAAAMMLKNMPSATAEATLQTGSTTGSMSMTAEATSMGMSMTPEATMQMNSATGSMSATAEATMQMNSSSGNMSSTAEATSMVGATCLYGTFSGLAEVPGPGATGAQGAVFVSVDPSTGNICYQEAISGITLPAKATHIHVNAAGVSGPIVVPFPVAPDASGMAEGCTTVTTPGLAQEIATNPAQYYVNVHTSDFPSGAARAQLSAWNASMSGGMMMTPEATMGVSGTFSTPAATMSVNTTMMTPEATAASGG